MFEAACQRNSHPFGHGVRYFKNIWKWLQFSQAVHSISWYERCFHSLEKNNGFAYTLLHTAIRWLSGKRQFNSTHKLCAMVWICTWDCLLKTMHVTHRLLCHWMRSEKYVQQRQVQQLTSYWVSYDKLAGKTDGKLSLTNCWSQWYEIYWLRKGWSDTHPLLVILRHHDCEIA